MASTTLTEREERIQAAAPEPARQPGRLPVPRQPQAGHLRRQGEVDQEARGRPLQQGVELAQRHGRRRSRASSSSPPRPRRRRCSPSRTSSSSTGRSSTSGCATTSRIPYIAISLDEKFPRVYFTREKHRRDRAYFGPYSNAKKVRETLDLLGKVFQHRSCDGAEPGPRVRQPVPRLLHQALRGALRRLRVRGGVPRGDRQGRRLPLRPLPPDRARPRGRDEAARRPRRSSRRPPRSATG